MTVRSRVAMARTKDIVNSEPVVDATTITTNQDEPAPSFKHHDDQPLRGMPRIILTSTVPTQREERTQRRLQDAVAFDAGGFQIPRISGSHGSISAAKYSASLNPDERLHQATPATSTARTIVPQLILPEIEPEKRPLVASYLASQAVQDAEQNLPLALQKIEAAKNLVPNRYDLMLTSAQLRLQGGYRQEAVRELRNADTLYRQSQRSDDARPADTDFLVAEARMYHALRESDRALARLDEVLSSDSSDIPAKIAKAQILLDGIDRLGGIELLLEALPELKRGSKEFYTLRTRAAEEIERLAFAAREEPKRKLQAFHIDDYAQALISLMPAFARCILDLRKVCADAHIQSMPVIIAPNICVASLDDAKSAVTEWAAVYLGIVKESDILEYFRKLNSDQMRQYSAQLIDATGMEAKYLYLLFYSGEAPQISMQLSPRLKAHCNALLRHQLMEDEICVYDPRELDGFCNAYAQMQSQYGFDMNQNDVKNDFEEYMFSTCDRIIESNNV